MWWKFRLMKQDLMSEKTIQMVIALKGKDVSRWDGGEKETEVIGLVR